MNKKFNKLKEILENKDDIKKELDGFYFNEKAINLLENTDMRFFINIYHNLTIANILNMIEDSDSLEKVYKVLLEEYKFEYAEAWYNNFCEVLNKIKL